MDARWSSKIRASTMTSLSLVKRSAPMPVVPKVTPRMSFKTSCCPAATVTVFVAVGAGRPLALLAKKSMVTEAAAPERLMMRTSSTKFSDRAPIALTPTGRNTTVGAKVPGAGRSWPRIAPPGKSVVWMLK